MRSMAAEEDIPGYFRHFTIQLERPGKVFIVDMEICLMLALITHIPTSSGILHLPHGHNMLSNFKPSLGKGNGLLYALCWSGS